MYILRFFLYSIILFYFVSCNLSKDNKTGLNKRKEKILRQKISQMLLLGFNGQEYNNISKDQQKELSKIGGIILYARNIKDETQITHLINDIQQNAKIPLFIAVDQEGGKVVRFNEQNGFKNDIHIESAKFFGQKNDINYTYQQNLSMAKRLRQIGINLNFTPVVDLDINNQSIIHIKERSFSSNANNVIKHASMVIKAHNEQQILCSLKHFPGHGSIGTDSHLGIADGTKTWSEIELLPYKKLLQRNFNENMIMVAHTMNNNLDEKYPASISKFVINDILLEKLNFKGIVITDDLDMGAISKYYQLSEVIIHAIDSGSNILMFSGMLDGRFAKNNKNFVNNIQNILINAIKNGTLNEEKINISYDKIIKAKKFLFEIPKIEVIKKQKHYEPILQEEQITLSEKALKILKNFELFVPHLYFCAGGATTIGYGHLVGHHTSCNQKDESFFNIINEYTNNRFKNSKELRQYILSERKRLHSIFEKQSIKDSDLLFKFGKDNKIFLYTFSKFAKDLKINSKNQKEILTKLKINNFNHKKALIFLKNDIKRHTVAVIQLQKELLNLGRQLKQHEIDALIMLTYNIGNTGFRESNLFDTIINNYKNKQKIIEHFRELDKDNHEIQHFGLQKRREIELRLFLFGEYNETIPHNREKYNRLLQDTDERF